MTPNHSFNIKGMLVDVFSERTYAARVTINNSTIAEIEEIEAEDGFLFIFPGFIDSHVHIESSMIVPAEFARLAVVHGTVATVSDPHEIANVCGMKGVEYMIENAKQVPFKFNFGAPSCVPATTFETAGAELNATDIEALLQRQEIKYLSEMMNFPGVLNQNADVIKKIAAAKKFDKPIDGHAPGLKGEQARQYIEAGITTDHECFTAEEALDKLKYRMKILIREGSAAKNFEALAELLNEHSERLMFCSDDKHPDSLAEGHINQLCARAVAKGIDVFKVLRAACINPVLHYKLDVGLLRVGDPADFIIVEDLSKFKIYKTFINGQLVAKNGVSKIEPAEATLINHFNCIEKTPADFAIKAELQDKSVWVIEALDGQLITNKITVPKSVLENKNGYLQSNTTEDILKIAVINRYQEDAVVKTAWIKNFGFKEGAIASSVAHDSHNIIAVGVDDEAICEAVNLVIKEHGGVSCVSNKESMVLALPVGGLMSNLNGYKVAQQYTAIDKMAKSLGSFLSAPFMTLSFMGLLVIPHLKLSDKGLFDGDTFKFVD